MDRREFLRDGAAGAMALALGGCAALLRRADEVTVVKEGRKIMRMLICAAVAAELLTASADASANAPAARFVNDICLPSNLWLLSDTPNDLFVQPFLKRWRPYDDFVRFSLSSPKKGAFERQLSHVATIARPEEGAVLTTELVNGDEFETVRRVTSTLRVGRKGVGFRDVYAQILGDSFTHGRFYQDALVESGYVPKLHLVGLLEAGGGQRNEGRGGWTLGSYFSVPKSPGGSYHGYLQPKDGRYWGNRAFWTMAWRCVRGTQPKGFEPSYSCARFDNVVGRFDEKTGVLLDPQPGDIQYDEEAKSFVRFDGTDWKAVPEKDLRWSFDYAKYLAMWKIPAPQFLFVLLGLNDFRSDIHADFTRWGEQIAIVKDSYLKAVPGGKFVLCIPCSTCGSIDNAGGAFTPRQNAAMWRFRDWLIRNFDRREKEGYYLLDAGISTDNDHGFELARGPAVRPFEKAPARAEPLKVQTGNPHPYPNYPAMGLSFAAFIQYYRADCAALRSGDNCLLVADAGRLSLIRPDASVAWEHPGIGDIRCAWLHRGGVWYFNGDFHRVDIVTGKDERVARPTDQKGLDARLEAAGDGRQASVEAVPLWRWPVGVVNVTAAEASAQDAIVKDAVPVRPAKARRVLVVSRAFGYCHNEALVFGDRALVRGGELSGAWKADVTADVSRLADAAFLAAYDAVAINNSTTIRAKEFPGMTETLTGFVKGGKGLCLIHSAVDSFYDDPAIADMNGGLFRGHPWMAGGTWSFRNEEPSHPVNAALKPLGALFARSDEIYQQTEPAYSRAKDRVLVSMNLADAPTAAAAKRWKGWLRADNDFAVSWVRRYGAGRVFYTSFGHDRRAFLDAARVGHIFAGLQYCLGDLPCDDAPRKSE